MIFQNNKDPFKRPICFKGGGGGDTYDAAYNARMATLSEEQQDWAREYMDYWRSDYLPMEQAQIEANMALLPLETQKAQSDLGRAITENQEYNTLSESRVNLARSNANLGMAQDEAAMYLLGDQTNLSKVQIADTMKAIEDKAPVRTAFYQQASEGVDANSRADKAQADVALGFAQSAEQLKRDLARTGVNPAGGSFSNMMNTTALSRAQAVGGARTQARENAEQENFSRLTTAMSY